MNVEGRVSLLDTTTGMYALQQHILVVNFVIILLNFAQINYCTAAFSFCIMISYFSMKALMKHVHKEQGDCLLRHDQ